jgi:hypothetical protein
MGVDYKFIVSTNKNNQPTLHKQKSVDWGKKRKTVDWWEVKSQNTRVSRSAEGYFIPAHLLILDQSCDALYFATSCL